MKPGNEGFYVDENGERQDFDLLHNVEACAHVVSDEIAMMMIDEMRKKGWEEWMIEHTYPDVYQPPSRNQQISRLLMQRKQK
jgi:hypothetical protein